MLTTIAIDAMGGDHGLRVTIPASLKISAEHRDVHIILVGDELQIRNELKNHSYDDQRITIKHASQQVEMGELPSNALRTKKDSSMRIAINLVQSQEAHACISAGNTGALVLTASFVLKTLPGVDRIAIMSEVPSERGAPHVRLLDLGANISASSEHLFQFAIMGSVVSKAADKIQNPKVGLLNIGSEEIKGNDLIKQTHYLLKDCSTINYIGYVEGNDIFSGNVDVIVCDGFVGNVLLKGSEGLAKFIGKMLKQAYMRNMTSKIAALMSRGVLNELKSKLDPGHYNGASLIGLQGVVIKSHGSADISAFAHAMREGIKEARTNVPGLIRDEVAKILGGAEEV